MAAGARNNRLHSDRTLYERRFALHAFASIHAMLLLSCPLAQFLLQCSRHSNGKHIADIAPQACHFFEQR